MAAKGIFLGVSLTPDLTCLKCVKWYEAVAGESFPLPCLPDILSSRQLMSCWVAGMGYWTKAVTGDQPLEPPGNCSHGENHLISYLPGRWSVVKDCVIIFDPFLALFTDTRKLSCSARHYWSYLYHWLYLCHQSCLCHWAYLCQRACLCWTLAANYTYQFDIRLYQWVKPVNLLFKTHLHTRLPWRKSFHWPSVSN